MCHTLGSYQIVMSTTTLCFTKSDIFFRMTTERGGKDKPGLWSIHVLPCFFWKTGKRFLSALFIILVRTRRWSIADV